MTTAHRPTYHPAVGSASAGGFRYYVQRQQVRRSDQVGHTKLKYRQAGQDTAEEVGQKDLLADLEEREKLHKLERDGADPQHLLTDETGSNSSLLQLTDGSDNAAATGHTPTDAIDPSAFNDEDDPVILAQSKNAAHNKSATAADSDDEDSDAEDERLLGLELERIKREREAQRVKQEQLAAEDEKIAAGKSGSARIEAELLASNPLLASNYGIDATSAGQQIKRRWNDDVVFRNQSRGEDITPKVQRRYINDTTRSDFHRSFLRKYVRDA